MVDFFKQKDKRDHTVYSCMIFLMFYIILKESWMYALAITSIIGIAKEFYDKHTPGRECSYKDVIADFFGIAVGLLITVIGDLRF